MRTDSPRSRRRKGARQGSNACNESHISLISLMCRCLERGYFISLDFALTLLVTLWGCDFAASMLLWTRGVTRRDILAFHAFLFTFSHSFLKHIFFDISYFS